MLQSPPACVSPHTMTLLLADRVIAQKAVSVAYNARTPTKCGDEALAIISNRELLALPLLLLVER